MWGPFMFPGQQPALIICDGEPGSGKSYSVADTQVQWRECGHPVVTNLAIKAMPYRFGDAVAKVVNILRKNRPAGNKWGEYVLLKDSDFECSTETAPRFLEILNQVKLRNPGKHILLVIDECPDYYPAEDQKNLSLPLKKFLRKHRHMDVSVVVTAQGYMMLPTVFRTLCKRLRYHRNLVSDPILNILLWWFSDNVHMSYAVRMVRGKPVSSKELMDRRYFFVKGKSVGQYYDTTQMHSAGDLKGGIRKAKNKVWRLGCMFGFLVIIFYAFLFIKWLVLPKPRGEKVKPIVSEVAKFPQELPMETAKLVDTVIDGQTVIETFETANGFEFSFKRPLAGQNPWDLIDRTDEITTRVPSFSGRPVAELVEGTYDEVF